MNSSAQPTIRTCRLSATRVRVLASVVLLASPLAVVGLGGLGALFSTRQIAQNALFQSGVINGVVQSPNDVLPGTLLQDGTTVLAFVALYAWLIIRRQRRREGLRSTVGSNLLLLGLVVVNVAVNNPLSNPRQWFGTVVIAMVLALPLFLTGFGKRVFIAGMLVVTALLFSYGNAVRGLSYESGQPKLDTIQTLEVSPDYDAAVEVSAADRYTQLEGLSYGRQLAGDVLFWVPRRFWADKPTGSGFVLGYFFRTATPNISAPLWAEGFVDFGWLGVVIFLMTFGYISARLDRGWASSYGALDLRRVVLPVVVGYSFILLRGPLLATMDKLTMFSIAFWLLCPMVRNTIGADVKAPAVTGEPASAARLGPVGRQASRLHHEPPRAS